MEAYNLLGLLLQGRMLTKAMQWRRLLAVELMHINLYIFLVAFFFIAIGTPVASSNGVTILTVAGVALLLLSIYIWLQSPALIRIQYGGKLTQVQAALFGFEGYVNAATIERAIFGCNFGRIGWSANNSPLSRFEVNEFGERVGIDPTTDLEIRSKVEQAKKAGPNDMRVSLYCLTFKLPLDFYLSIWLH